MYKFYKVNLSVSTVVYIYKTAILNELYTTYCKVKLYDVNDKKTYKDFISKVMYGTLWFV